MKSHGRIASNIPGRLRLRLHRPKLHPELMRHVKTHLTKCKGVHLVETNPATGSITIQYDPHTHSHTDLITILHDLGVILYDVVADGRNSLPSTGNCSAAVQINQAISDLNRRLFRLTGGKVDLKLMVPLAMATLGIRQILREGLGISRIPGYILIWYAVDAFYRLHQQPQQTTGG